MKVHITEHGRSGWQVQLDLVIDERPKKDQNCPGLVFPETFPGPEPVLLPDETKWVRRSCAY